MNTRSHRHLLALFFPLLALFLAAPLVAHSTFDAPSTARDSGAHQDGRTHVDVLLVTDHEQVARGDTFRVGVLFDLDEAWHIYWENPGDAGLPTSIEWSGEGLEFGPLHWAVPGIYTEQDGLLTTFGYDDQVLLYSDATVLSGAPPELRVDADIHYLACQNACIPGEHSLTRTIPQGDSSIRAPREIQALFDEFSLKEPRDASALGMTTRASLIDERNALVELILCDGPDDSCPADAEVLYDQLAYAMVASSQSDSSFLISSVIPHPNAFKGWIFQLQLDAPLSTEDKLSAVFRIDDGEGTMLPLALTTALHEATADDIALFDSALQSSDSEDNSRDRPALLYILLLAFLGGLILNLMPCVFPVLAIKVASFTELAQKDRRQVLSHGIAYTAGITSSLLLLASVVAGLQIAGTQVGWGFQFQQPLFLAALALIIFVFALNSFGVFEVSVSANRLNQTTDKSQGLRRSFAEGILAVVLATPCSAPFLGTAIGFALTAHPALILLIFFVLGLGLAAPFVALTLIPGATRMLPRPGAWMSHLKHFLGFALLGATIWLVWLVGRLAGVDAMGRMLVLLGGVSISAWIYGLVQFKPWQRTRELSILLSLAILVAATSFAFPLDDGEPDEFSSAREGLLEWQTWSEDAVQRELQEGRGVFVNFTADWCLTCKTNERTSITDARVLQAIEDKDIAVFKADWTRPDETIRQALQDHGKGGVPMYLFYPAGDQDPEVLPELLTPTMLLNRFEPVR